MRSPAAYGRFTNTLIKAGMVRLKREQCTATVGIFFVRKKSGMLRIIFDTRVSNCIFVVPDHVDLPSAAAFGGIEADSKPLYTVSGDIDCAFYRLAIPDDLGENFRLPPIRGRYLGFSKDERLSQILRV